MFSAHEARKGYMKTKEQILKEYGLDFGWMSSRSHENLIKSAMEEYAEEKLAASRVAPMLSAVPSAIELLDKEEKYLGQCMQDSEGTIDISFEIEAIAYCKSILQRGIAG